MKEDLPAALRKMSSFLGKNLSDEVIKKIAEHCSFDTMKNNPCPTSVWYQKFTWTLTNLHFSEKALLEIGKTHFTNEQLNKLRSTINKDLEGESFTLPWKLD
ncbi:hypothetical protein WMY93_026736 [Mugilogobius chulae]|uniref:Sulfotransferase n=1 Tax=Mugilogobius chulae TaxID=88201 RepID=A0AAW0N2S0_9GOBI